MLLTETQAEVGWRSTEAVVKDDDRVASCVVVGDSAGDGGVDRNHSGSCFAVLVMESDVV